MMKLEDLLKQDGWSDAEIAAVGPMLQEPRFRASMEKQYGAVASERDQLKERDSKWQEKLDTEWQPRVNALETAERKAREEKALLAERLKIAKDHGYISEDEDAAAAAAAEAERNNRGNFDPSKYVSMEDAQRMLEAEGRAIAMAADINNEYAYLTGGKTLYEYETEIDGRHMRGLSALREEAKSKRMNLDRYIAEKFDFAGKRTALAAKRQQDHDDAIRKDEADKVRNELASQYGNPMMRTAVPSRNPILPPKRTDGKQPWDVPPAERKADRLERAMKAQLTGAVN